MGAVKAGNCQPLQDQTSDQGRVLSRSLMVESSGIWTLDGPHAARCLRTIKIQLKHDNLWLPQIPSAWRDLSPLVSRTLPRLVRCKTISCCRSTAISDSSRAFDLNGETKMARTNQRSPITRSAYVPSLPASSCLPACAGRQAAVRSPRHRMGLRRPSGKFCSHFCGFCP